MAHTKRDEEDLTDRFCVPLSSLTTPIEVGEIGYTRAGSSVFFAWPPFGPLLFENESSDARDHCANERSEPQSPLFPSRLESLVPVKSLTNMLRCRALFAAWPGASTKTAFLSYLKLSVYMAIASIVITMSFHIKRAPTELELKMAKPIGAVFWLLSVMTLLLGVGNYMRTVNQYSQKAAIVQSGWKTQLSLGVLATCLVATCMILRWIAINDRVRALGMVFGWV
ncbi:unnamed protein product [Clonostachys byssicola]|uniref:DUF202 domain-containing protein n=1 Tax=Clonostachys byssicola TaxID=160290 RepID=A0A9N9US67_9HYPO|nr:unnamed protein product [Clonostachys byssicola]